MAIEGIITRSQNVNTTLLIKEIGCGGSPVLLTMVSGLSPMFWGPAFPQFWSCREGLGFPHSCTILSYPVPSSMVKRGAAALGVCNIRHTSPLRLSSSRLETVCYQAWSRGGKQGIVPSLALHLGGTAQSQGNWGRLRVLVSTNFWLASKTILDVLTFGRWRMWNLNKEVLFLYLFIFALFTVFSPQCLDTTFQR